MAPNLGTLMLTFVIHVRRTPEVLARVVLLFHGRRIEIDSLVAGRAELPDVMRIEATVESGKDKARLIEANLYKLADVLLVERTDFDKEPARPATEDGNRES
jgi:acetolactate synthase small subunit